ncbi:MAG: hypothetical protein L0227_16190 [Chloroflexi bacterium]|nr:hypothetical protein [Chloroflexota bacterium]
MDAPGSSTPPLEPSPLEPSPLKPPSGAPPPSPRPRSPLRLVLSIAMILAGVVWIGQGLGILTAGRSFMIGDPTWAVIGASFAIAGLIVVIRERRRA